MSNVMYGIVILGLVIAGIRYLASRKNAGSGSNADRDAGPPTSSGYAQDREEARLAKMSDEDRVWQAASLQRAADGRWQRQEQPASRPQEKA